MWMIVRSDCWPSNGTPGRVRRWNWTDRQCAGSQLYSHHSHHQRKLDGAPERPAGAPDPPAPADPGCGLCHADPACSHLLQLAGPIREIRNQKSHSLHVDQEGSCPSLVVRWKWCGTGWVYPVYHHGMPPCSAPSICKVSACCPGRLAFRRCAC